MTDIKIFNSAFDFVGVVDSVIECEFSEAYNEDSTFNMRVAYSEQNRKLFLADSYICFGERLFIINNIRYTDKEISARGESMFALFKHVLIEEPRLFDGNPYEIVCEMAEMASFTNLTYEVFGTVWNSSQNYNSVCSVNTSIYTEIKNVCNVYDFGFHIRFYPDEKRLVFQIMPKQDRTWDTGITPYAVSDKQGVFEVCTVESDTSNFKNYAHVPYGYIDDEYVYMNVDKRNNLYEDKRAMSVSVPGVLPSRVLNEALYYLGQLALSKRRKRGIFTVEMIKDVGASVGDVCDFESERDGYLCHALVKKIIRRESKGGIKDILVLEKEDE